MAIVATYCKLWNTLIEAPDPDAYIKTEGVPVGKFSQGLPVIQGREMGTLTWSVMRLSDYHDLYALWNTNKASSGSFVVPPHSGDDWDTWRTITAFCDPPTCEYRGNQVFNVSITLHVGTSLA